MRIVSRLRGGSPGQIKANYMEIVPEFEKPEELMSNRLKLRRYLKELVQNQKRIPLITENRERAQK